MIDGYGQLCPECGDPYIGGPGCYKDACGAEPEDDGGSRPVTAPNPADEVAALAEASGDPAAFRLVYSILMQRYDDSCRVGHMTQFADEVAAVAVQTLRDAGRLVPPDADTRAEVGVRMTWDDGSVTEDACERSLADARVRFHAERRSVKPDWRVVKAEVIERTWRASPWVPVPTTPTAGESDA